MCRFAVAASLLVMLGATSPATQRSPADVLFTDDFERGLGRWRTVGDGILLHASGDPVHRTVMRLSPSGDVFALIRGSEQWGPVRLEGDMLFPTGVDNYLGFLYNFREPDLRSDFGLVYLKGNDNYLQANPHRDLNVSRTVYPEVRSTLTGDAVVKPGQWQHFAMEVYGPHCHVYVGGSAEPQMTFSLFEFESGAIGLQPRSVGGDVWVDNVVVRRLTRLAYGGPPVPLTQYSREGLLTEWQVAGPFDRTRDELARTPNMGQWIAFQADPRGAVITGRVVDYHGPLTVAYLRTTITAAADGEHDLEISTADDLALWVNGRFIWFIPRQDYAWFDFFRQPRHQGQKIPLTLGAGSNDLVLRVRGGVYATGGFYARVVARTR